MNKVSLDLKDYSDDDIKNYALKFLKAKNTSIEYYNSDKGKEKYREGSRKYYRNHRDKCLETAKKRYADKLKKEGKIVQNRRGRPKKNPANDNI